MKYKLWDAVIIIERNEDYNEYFYGLYAGSNLSLKYPDLLHFWIWIDKSQLWERHAFDSGTEYDSDIQSHDMKKIIENIFKAKKWTVAH